VGGNVIGNVLKNLNLGVLGNSIAGIVGGGIGGQLLGLLGMAPDAAAGMDISSILTSVASGGAGGGIVMVIVGMVKNMMAKQ
jgi:uncharacterized membrane protein YeaQ/YmgE (transglycosylase-associated protein family)